MKTLQYFISLTVIALLSVQALHAQTTMTDEEKANYQRLKTDWPNLQRYREANEKLGLPVPGEKRVVFMGNSITEGWLDFHPEFFTNKAYVDRGISGQTTPQMLVRFRQDVINLKPKVVVIMAGVNDIAGNTGPATLEMIEDNLASMAEVAKANKITVILCSVLPAYDFPWNPGTYPSEKIFALNAWIKKYAAANKITYVDYYSVMVDERKGLKAAYTYDGVHPNLEGYKFMEPIVEKAIKAVLKAKYL